MRDKVTGVTGYLVDDPDAERPFTDDDAVCIVVLHGRYVDPSMGRCGRTPDEVASWCHDNAAKWYTVPLWMYDHSGTTYGVGLINPFSCPWDSGRVGIVALRRVDWGNGDEPDSKMFEYASSVASGYSRWANGDCWGYVVEDADGEELSSCWGFIGQEDAREEMVDSFNHYVAVRRQAMYATQAEALEASRPDMYVTQGGAYA
jgi:hypothetical protein